MVGSRDYSTQIDASLPLGQAVYTHFPRGFWKVCDGLNRSKGSERSELLLPVRDSDNDWIIVLELAETRVERDPTTP